MGRPQDEDSSAGRVTAKSRSAGGVDGPLLEKREKWRTPRVSCVSGQRQPASSANSLLNLARFEIDQEVCTA